MKRKKGIVLEVNKNKVIVLTPDGQFLEHKISGQPPSIGSEIELTTSHAKGRNLINLGIAAVLILTFIPLLVWQLFVFPQIPVAYVSVDINPSIELGLNRYDKVISSKGLNQDGINLLKNIDLNNLPVEKALEIVTEKAIQENYINTDKENAVIISYSKSKPVKKSPTKISSNNSPPREEVALAKEEVLESTIKQVIERNQQQAIIEIVQVSPKVRDKADQLGLSTGKYTLMLEAWDEGLEISPESIKGNSIITAIKEKGINPGEFISQIKKKNYNAKKLEELTLKYASRLDQLKNSSIEPEIIAEHKVIEGENREADSLTGNSSSENLNFNFPNKGRDKSNIDHKSGKIPPEKQNDLRSKENSPLPEKEKEIEKEIKKPAKDFNLKFANENNNLGPSEKEGEEESLEEAEAEDEAKNSPGKDKDNDKEKTKEKKSDKDEARDKLEKWDNLNGKKNNNEKVKENNKDKDKEKDKDNPSATKKDKENTNYPPKYEKQNNSTDKKGQDNSKDLNGKKGLEKTNEDNEKQQDANKQTPDELEDSNEEIRRSKAGEKMPENIRAMLRNLFTNKKWE